MKSCSDVSRMHAAARGVAVICAALFLATGWAQELRPLPPHMRILSDEIHALSDAEGVELSRSLQEVVDSTGILVVMVIAETTKPEPIREYAERLARQWARERAIEPARSIFVIVAVSDREMQVLPGRDLRWGAKLSETDVTRDLAPLFRERRYFEALTKLTALLRATITKHER